MVATICFGLLLGGVLLHFARDLPPREKDLFGMVVSMFVVQGGIILWIAFFLREKKIAWSQAFGFRIGGLTRVFLLGTLSGLFVLPAAGLLQQLTAIVFNAFHRQPHEQEAVRLIRETIAQPGPDAISVAQQVFFALAVIVIAPVAEELFFRGILYASIRQAGYPRAALWGSSILFAMTHFNLLSFAPLVLLAIILARLYEETDNLLTPMLTHSLFNGANFIFMLYERRLLQSLPV